VLFRLDRAFQSFFRRVKAGQKPGFPRFKGRNRGVRSFDIPKPVIRDGSLYVKGIGRFGLPDLPEGEIVSARVVKTPLRVTVQFIVAVEDRPRAPDMPMGMDTGLKERATLSTGEVIPAVYLDRRALKRKQRALARAKRGRRKKLKALQRAYERVSVSERSAFHRISTAIVKRHNRIAVEDLQIGNMMKNPNLSRSIAGQSWGRLVDQLTYKAESAGGSVIRVAHQHTSTDYHACGNRQPMPLSVREFVCRGCGLVTDRDVNAARNILQWGISLAGWCARCCARDEFHPRSSPVPRSRKS